MFCFYSYYRSRLPPCFFLFVFLSPFPAFFCRSSLLIFFFCHYFFLSFVVRVFFPLHLFSFTFSFSKVCNSSSLLPPTTLRYVRGFTVAGGVHKITYSSILYHCNSSFPPQRVHCRSANED
ncbi:hypothetical protein E2C01_064040 [Portunus trituberculatus]|uniref:Uncharacterized protein n=1 Tax=Portunus trituberculatus TaxID=210409 RepID=A0A5B7HJ99_PORTR|nr:hypothetical protein [Portunus trituberculatus]